MKYLATLALSIVFSTVIFGPVLFQHVSSHEMMTSNDTCLATTISSIDCPEVTDSLSMAMHHLDALNVLTEGLSSAGVASYFTLLSLIIVALVYVLAKFLTPTLDAERVYQRFRTARVFIPSSEFRITHWLSLLELSPSYVGST